MMFVAISTRTMANAKPKFRRPDGVVRTVEEMRQERAAARDKAIREAETARRAVLRKKWEEAREKALAKELREAESPFRSHVQLRRIVERACHVFRITKIDITSQRRSTHVAFARQFVMYWAARRTGLSTPQIGRVLGKRDHTTVIHGKAAYVVKRAKMGRTLRAAR